MRMSKEFKASVAVLSAGMLLWACGRPSNTLGNFELDGVGDPRVPTGNVILGKYAGTFDMTRWRTSNPKYASLTPHLDNDNAGFPLFQGLWNASSIEGLAGLGLLVISTPPAMQLGDSRAFTMPGNGQRQSACYFDLGVFPVLGGSLNTLDAGERMTFEWGSGGSANRQRVVRDPDDAYGDPQQDLIFYVSDFDTLNPSIPDGEDLYVTWTGGTLAGRGYAVAPPRTAGPGSGSQYEVLRIPEEVLAPGGSGDPLINGLVAGTASIPTASEYEIEWEPSSSDTQLLGMQIIVQIYGPANLGTVEEPDVNDLPYFNRLGSLVCTVPDEDGRFSIPQATLDELMAVVEGTAAYRNSTEDANGDGVLQEYTPSGPLGGGGGGEDNNGNGVDDKVYGAALIINRRTENEFLACTRGLSEAECRRADRAFITGNNTKYYPMAWAEPAP